MKIFIASALLSLPAVLGCVQCSTSYPDQNALKQSYYPPGADCIDYKIPISIAYQALPFNASRWENNFDLTTFLVEATTRAGADYPSPVGGLYPVKGNYEIAASFCSPKQKNGKEKTVILATHGIGIARQHWNSPEQPDTYNFVQSAIGQGYSVFFYDRLGCGASTRISGYQSQINTAVAVLSTMAKMVRNGQYTGSIGKPSKLALMGFSFGSYTTNLAIAAEPNLADAIILTGIGFNTTGLNLNGLVRSFVPRVAALQNPHLYGDRDFGYWTWVDEFAQIYNYFKESNYDTAIAAFTEAAKQPFSVLEFLTFASFTPEPIAFSGPALHITGQTDYIVCDGDCVGIYDEPSSTIYANAKLEHVLVPGASHNINFHKNAPFAYKAITDFLGKNGL